MNCTLKKIKGTVYACTKQGCGRIIKIEGAKPSDARFAEMPCRRTSDTDLIDPALVARAEALAAPTVDKGDGKLTGPGTELRALLGEMGYTPKGCNCKSTEMRMNRLGVDGCRKQLDALCCEVMKNARKQKVEITVEMARFAIEEAIRRAEQAASAKPDAPAAARRDAERCGRVKRRQTRKDPRW